jgi:hypothetical protein
VFLIDDLILLEAKNQVKKNGFEIEEFVLILAGISENEEIDLNLVKDIEIEEIKLTYANGRQLLTIPEIVAYEKELNECWRNGFIGSMIKEKDPLTKTLMRFYYYFGKYCLSMERALITNDNTAFYEAVKSAVKMIAGLGSMFSVVMARLSIIEKANRKRRGKEIMLKTSSGNIKRDNKIKAAYVGFAIEGRQREAAGILASRFNMTAGQIRRIVKEACGGLPMHT